MRHLITLTAVLFLLFVFSPESSAMRHGETVTPYGDSCASCGHYGTCNKKISSEDAEKAMTDYYGKKGLNVEILDVKERFIKANVKNRDKTVDTIIFDRRTGRIRSTY